MPTPYCETFHLYFPRKTVHGFIAPVFAVSSLQVFENEGHASIHSTRTKEGLSLFGSHF
jgi:hypothetical protein